jgi:hypothetical protein
MTASIHLSKLTNQPPEDATVLKALYDRLIAASNYDENDKPYIVHSMSLADIAELIVDARVAISELLDI